VTDWNKPDVDDLNSNVLLFLNSKVENAAKHDYGSDTNIPVGAIRKNPSTKRPEEWDGSSWNQLSWMTDILNHIANNALHSALPIGAIVEWGYSVSPPPANFLLCDGSAVLRADYPTLHTLAQAAGYPDGAGNGTTTFNLPNYVGRIPFGKTASGTGSTLGGTFGSVDHTHSNPAHPHSVAPHSHAMDHAHLGGSHQHGQTSHTHNVLGHYHDAQGAGADINITSSGAHQHDINSRANGVAGGGNQLLQAANLNSATVSSANNSTPNHVHPHANVVGKVGNVSGGVNGDGSFATDAGNSGSVNTASAGAVATSQISNNVSGSGVNTAAVALTTATDGATTSGSNNPPCKVCYFLIKAL